MLFKSSQDFYNWERVKEILIKIIYFTMPIGVIKSTKVFMVVAVPLLVVTALFEIYKKGFKKSFYEKYMIFWLLTLLISIIFSNHDKKLGLLMLGNIIVFSFLPTLLGQIKLKKENLKIFIMASYFATCFLFKRFFIELIQVVKIYSEKEIKFLDLFKSESINTILNASTQGYRLTLVKPGGHFFALATTASFLTIIIIMSLIYIYKSQDKLYYKIVAVIFGIISLIFLILTQSRAGYLSLIIFFIMIIFIEFKKKLLKVFVPVIGMMTYISIKFVNNPFVQRVKEIGAVNEDVSILGRFEVYKESFRIFKNNILSGVGLENFIVAQDLSQYKVTEKYYHSHNMALKLLCETGILGFFSYFLMMYKIIRNLIKKIDHIDGLLTFSVLIIFLIFENFEILLLKVYLHSYVFFIIGIGINSFYKKTEK